MIQEAIADPSAAAHLIYSAHLRELILSFSSFYKCVLLLLWFFIVVVCLGFLATSLSLHLVYSLLALLFANVQLPLFLRGQTQNLFQDIRVVISRVVTFTPATHLYCIRLIVHHCIHRSGLENNNISTIFLTALNILIESIYVENCCRHYFFSPALCKVCLEQRHICFVVIPLLKGAFC